jgi:coenzyme F420 hydrogenase subunit beta
LLSLQDVVENKLCISCGICVGITNDQNTDLARMQYNSKTGMLDPHILDSEHEWGTGPELNVCPGKGYPIEEMGAKLYRLGESAYSVELGHYLKYGSARTGDPVFSSLASSGGLIPSLSYYLLASGKVDGILTVKYTYNDMGMSVSPFIAKTKEDLIASQGSKYQPIPLLKDMSIIQGFEGTLAVIGTPCQIAAVRLAQSNDEQLYQHVKYTISNFCGGFRDLREQDRIFDIFDVNQKLINHFSYRGGKQPGSMSISQSGSEVIEVPYPNYSRLTGYPKYFRCRTCVDATGELADISFGDAWINRLLKSDFNWSCYIIRSPEMKEILSQMIADKWIIHEDISHKELLQSQAGNLLTKKVRQYSRYKLFKFFKKKIPVFDGGYLNGDVKLWREVRIFLKYQALYLLENVRLYYPIAKIVGRIKHERTQD